MRRPARRGRKPLHRSVDADIRLRADEDPPLGRCRRSPTGASSGPWLEALALFCRTPARAHDPRRRRVRPLGSQRRYPWTGCGSSWQWLPAPRPHGSPCDGRTKGNRRSHERRKGPKVLARPVRPLASPAALPSMARTRRTNANPGLGESAIPTGGPGQLLRHQPLPSQGQETRRRASRERLRGAVTLMGVHRRVERDGVAHGGVDVEVNSSQTRRTTRRAGSEAGGSGAFASKLEVSTMGRAQRLWKALTRGAVEPCGGGHRHQ